MPRDKWPVLAHCRSFSLKLSAGSTRNFHILLTSKIILVSKFEFSVRTQMSGPVDGTKRGGNAYLQPLWQSPTSMQDNPAVLELIYFSHKPVQGAALPPELLSRPRLSQFKIASQSAQARHSASALVSCDLGR